MNTLKLSKRRGIKISGHCRKQFKESTIGRKENLKKVEKSRVRRTLKERKDKGKLYRFYEAIKVRKFQDLMQLYRLVNRYYKPSQQSKEKLFCIANQPTCNINQLF